MGAVDLVSSGVATSVASGIQRIGRAGHSVGEPSKGTIFPKYRGDLSRPGGRRPHAAGEDRDDPGAAQPARRPRQQIVAMTAMREWSVSALSELVHRAYPFSDLGRGTGVDARHAERTLSVG